MLDGNQWDFLLKTVEDTTVVSLALNGQDILDSARAAAGSFIIPSIYEESGNFFFVTQNFQLPFYTAFNVTQSLVYINLTAEELGARVSRRLPAANHGGKLQPYSGPAIAIRAAGLFGGLTCPLFLMPWRRSEHPHLLSQPSTSA